MDSASPGDVLPGDSSRPSSDDSSDDAPRRSDDAAPPPSSGSPSSESPSSTSSTEAAQASRPDSDRGSSPSSDPKSGSGSDSKSGSSHSAARADARRDEAETEAADGSAGEAGRDRASLRKLDASARIIWGLKYAAAWGLFLFAVFFYDLTHLFGPSWLPFGVLSGGVLVVGTLYCIAWPQLRYRRWGFALRPEELYLEHGVLTNVRTIVPLRRIQHLDVSQDLLEREFGLGRLIVHTAGSRSSDVVIPGLPLDEAERIRDEVKRFILEDPLMEDPV